MKRLVTATLACLTTATALAETFDVSVISNRYEPNDLTIAPGDTVRWTNNQGFHDVVEDNAAFSSGGAAGPGWVFERTFNDPGEIFYHCTVHSAAGRDINIFMNGRINVEAPNNFLINQGIAGAWFNNATAGQGFLVDVDTENSFIFIAWFTYLASTSETKVGSDGQRWLTMQGTFNGPSASIPIFNTSGGEFNDSAPVMTDQVGTATVSFTDCSNGSVDFDLPDDGLSGTIPITRLLPATSSLCEDLSAATEETLLSQSE